MLSNAYFLAKFRFDTAENEPAKLSVKFCKKTANFANFAPRRFLLRACDLSWAARPNTIFMRWSERYMEECFRQGDAEKRIGIPVSAFCDRDATVPDKVGRLRIKDPDMSYLYFEIWGMINC